MGSMSEAENTNESIDIDQNSVRILEVIAENGEASTSEITPSVDLAYGSIHHRYEKLEDYGLITEVPNGKQEKRLAITDKGKDYIQPKSNEESPSFEFHYPDYVEREEFGLLGADKELIKDITIEMPLAVAVMISQSEVHGFENVYKSTKAFQKYTRDHLIQTVYEAEGNDLTQQELADKYDISQSAVNSILNKDLPDEPPEPPYNVSTSELPNV